MHPVYKTGVLLPFVTMFYLLSEWIYLLNFLRELSYFIHKNDMYFIVLSFLVHKIFTFYIKSALKFACPNQLPKVSRLLV